MAALPEHPERQSPEPRRLSEGLARLYGAGVPVPPQVDEAILRNAARRMQNARRFRMVLGWGGAVAAAAAMVVVALRFVGPQPQMAPSPAAQVQLGDLNADGRVDMLDAYLLARKIQAGEKLPLKYDINGDGTVDQRDVDAIAHRAVSLTGGPVQ